jgi:predicted nucleotidyltransferase
MPEISLDQNFREFLELLNSAKIKYLVIGGYAVNYHGHHRFTGDIDLWVAVEPTNAERLSAALEQFGFSPGSVPPSLFLELGRVFQFGRVPVRIDLLTGPSGVEFEGCYARRVEAELDGVNVPIIGLDVLKANKRASGRDKDLQDLKNLPPHEGPTPGQSGDTGSSQ